MDQQQQRIHLQEVNGDIILAEKKLQRLSSDVTNFEESKAAGLREYDNQIKKKQAEIDALTLEGKRLQGLSHIYSNAIQNLRIEKETQEKINIHLIEKAQTDVLLIHQVAKEVREAAQIQQKKVKVFALTVLLRHVSVVNMSAALTLLKKQLDIKQEAIEKQDRDVTERERSANVALAESQKLLEDINRQLPEKQKMLTNLNEFIEKRKKEAEQIGILAAMRLAEANRLLSGVARKEKLQRAKSIELNKKELWLNDREATVGRAYRETISRGGRVTKPTNN